MIIQYSRTATHYTHKAHTYTPQPVLLASQFFFASKAFSYREQRVWRCPPTSFSPCAYVDVDVDVGSVQNLDLAGDYLGHEQKVADGSNAHYTVYLSLLLPLRASAVVRTDGTNIPIRRPAEQIICA